MVRYPRHTALTAAAAFVLSALLCGLLSALSAGPVYRVPVIPEPFSSPGTFLSEAARLSPGSLLSSALVFLSGFAVCPKPVCAFVMTWRGACLGYSLSSLKTGSLIFLREKRILGIPSSAFIPLIFLLASLILIVHSYLAASFSCRFRNDRSAVREVVRFSVISLVFCGALIVLDVARCFMI